jgi:putative hemolysin
MNPIALEILIIILLLLINGVLAMAEMSLVSARKARLKALADRGNHAAGVALELAQSPNQFLSTVQIGITLVGILAGAFGGATLAQWIAAQFTALGLAPYYAVGAGLALVVLMITFLSLVIGELVPKRLALGSPERFACLLASPMRRLARIARPAVRVLGWATDLVLKIIGAPREAPAQVTDDEVRVLMQEGRLAGVFHSAEPEMVDRVLELDDLMVKEIMTPRPKVVFVNQDDPHEIVWHKIVASRHSYFPVYQGSRDHIVGVVSVKAIYANVAAGARADLRTLMIAPFFVPATQSVVVLLESFRKSGRHFAVVADEFGSVVGVVTLVDVLETIIGEVPSQEERRRPEVRQREDGTALADGTVEIEALEKALPGLRFGSDEERTYQTLAGFVLEHLGYIPAEAEIFTALGWKFEIIDMDGPRIDKILLTPQAPLLPVQP